MAQEEAKTAKPPSKWPAHVMPYEEFLEIWQEYGITTEDVEAFFKVLTVTPEEQREIYSADQRSEKWFSSRGRRLTASNFGSVCGQNPFSSANRVLKDMLWPRKFTCEAVRWGQDNEPLAAKVFETFIRAQDPDVHKITFPGLVVSVEKPWFGASPDGCVHMRNGKLRGLEIKCPFRKEIYPYCPAYYYAQMMGTAGLLGLQSYYFVVWTPDKTLVEEYEFHRDYFTNVMIPTMEKFYFERYLPLAILKDKNLLPEDSILPPPLLSSSLERPLILPLAETPPEDASSPPDFVWAS
jgi:putative phage-type endonuclease